MDNYAISEDGVTVYAKDTGEAICVCGSEGTSIAFNDNKAVRESWAVVICRFLNQSE